MTIADIEEYNAFGPWIADVSTEAEIPRVFRGHGVDLASASLALKIPRNIDRRDARPGMDLFDHLLLVHDGQLSVLSRSRDAVTSSRMAISSIAAIEDSVDLLDGRMTIHAPDERLTISYNGTSRSAIGQLVTALRRDSTGGAPRVGAATDVEPNAVLAELRRSDLALSHELTAFQRSNPAAVLLGAHPRQQLRPPAGMVSQVSHRLRPATLHGAVLFATSSELHMLHRRAQLARGSKPTLSSAHTIVNLDTIRSVTEAPHPLYGAVTVMQISVGSSAIELLLPTDSTAVEALRRL